ncbi:MAG: hypothetical protein WCE42_08075, partial [Rhizobium ruizarguesonis]
SREVLSGSWRGFNEKRIALQTRKSAASGFYCSNCHDPTNQTPAIQKRLSDASKSEKFTSTMGLRFT